MLDCLQGLPSGQKFLEAFPIHPTQDDSLFRIKEWRSKAKVVIRSIAHQGKFAQICCLITAAANLIIEIRESERVAKLVGNEADTCKVTTILPPQFRGTEISVQTDFIQHYVFQFRICGLAHIPVM